MHGSCSRGVWCSWKTGRSLGSAFVGGGSVMRSEERCLNDFCLKKRLLAMPTGHLGHADLMGSPGI